jgi:hypothetical protein
MLWIEFIFFVNKISDRLLGLLAQLPVARGSARDKIGTTIIIVDLRSLPGTQRSFRSHEKNHGIVALTKKFKFLMEHISTLQFDQRDDPALAQPHM